MDCSLPGSSIHGIWQARVLEWGAIVHVEIFAAVITDMYGKHECYYVNVLTMYKNLNIAPVLCFHSLTSLDTVIFLQ